ncbi:MAG: NYN domain-containing protein [Sulfuricurvum sp.]|uniref:NYN domain-containing protein n=1 Tax=Sulfuricurvum sp. TaxID=2025608 RepID=UPI002638D2C4|nr:NYN domain-containing protein [Sulfuricurvum sp.]MDD2829210.1 NYN domain-containing protein [Sulfuricurvum sp.]MDD4949043.1 NYN domain-containing protein [Sulfuricurvum sp.]
MNQNQARLAVLIDADNSQPSIIAGLLDEIASHGIASVKRIYGDWTDTKLKSWKNELLEHGLHPMQQFAYTTGKNATDSAMIIDAMDLLYTKNFDGFCIVSSDSDFTRLASRIRESGVKVYGFGEQKTPKSFIGACDKFIYTENLRRSNSTIVIAPKLKHDEKALLALVKNAVEDTTNEAGWSYLGAIGQNLINKSPEFDPRSFGYKKLVDLIEGLGVFEFKYSDPLSGSQSIHVRLKRHKRSYEK